MWKERSRKAGKGRRWREGRYKKKKLMLGRRKLAERMASGGEGKRKLLTFVLQ